MSRRCAENCPHGWRVAQRKSGQIMRAVGAQAEQQRTQQRLVHAGQSLSIMNGRSTMARAEPLGWWTPWSRQGVLTVQDSAPRRSLTRRQFVLGGAVAVSAAGALIAACQAPAPSAPSATQAPPAGAPTQAAPAAAAPTPAPAAVTPAQAAPAAPTQAAASQPGVR